MSAASLRSTAILFRSFRQRLITKVDAEQTKREYWTTPAVIGLLESPVYVEGVEGSPLGECLPIGSGASSRMRLEDHPTVRRLSQKAPPISSRGPLDASMLRQLALDQGADDAGLVEINRPALEPQRQEILRNYPWTRSLLSFVVRMARESVRGAPRS